MGNPVPAATNADYGSWLNEYQWDYFVTLTTRHPGSERSLTKEFKDCFVRRLDKVAQRSISWFYVVEYSANREPHLHVLLWANGKLSRRQLETAWKLGYTEVRAYDRSLGGTYYVTKTVTTSHPDNYDFSRFLPPVRDGARRW